MYRNHPAAYPLLLLILIALALPGCRPEPPRALPSPIILTATPPGVPTDPALTATFTATEAPPVQATPIPTDTPTITPTELIPPTGFAPPVFEYTRTPGPPRPPSGSSGGGSGGGGGGSPILPAYDVPHTVNLLLDPGFEGSARAVEFDEVRVVEGWHPFYCARPYTASDCAALRGDSVGVNRNSPDLKYDIPEYGLAKETFRIKGGEKAQRWWCEYRVCMAGVYQTFATQPGQVCEVGAWVQSYSAAADTTPPKSDLKTDDDRDNATWYIRVDPAGGAYAWDRTVISSRPFGYADGIYDKHVLINYYFVATGSRATVYFQNVRLWPLKNNENFIDDAYAYCYTPSPPPPVGSPFERGLRIGGFQPVKSPEYALGPGGAGAWDASGVGAKVVVPVGNELWMYYGSGAAAGVVVSTDGGYNWVRRQSGPVFSPLDNPSWASDFSDFTVLRDPATGKFEMWYLIREDANDQFTYRIMYATSPDGLNWQRVGNGPVARRGPPGSWYEERYGALNAVLVNGLRYIYHDGTMLAPDWQRQIGCRVTSNGVDLVPCDVNPVLSPHPDFNPFEANEVESPSVIYHNGLWLMAYTGFGEDIGQVFRIGIAASYDGQHWHRWSLGEAVNWLPTNESTSGPILRLDAATNTLWLWYHAYGRVYAATAPITLP